MSQNKIISCLSTSIAILSLSQPCTLAQTLFVETFAPTQINQLSIPQKLIIPPIAQTEISAAGSAISDSVKNQQDLLTPPSFHAVITRELPKLWQMRVPIEQVGFLYATYELRAENGRNNAVSNENASSSTVQVVIEPLPIIEISRDRNTNTALVQGGMRLRMDLSTAQLAGGYSGEMTVTVNRR
ncbi:MAG: hypothetical protein HWQ41_01030 [Nostoc sp. NOS(2021)]|uniref:hypothetical protein n=1 Tax=Nostoc sp. NOS(2021) TaxID=2815407 RepID=UPI0025D37CCB|nr:hypothetical protein [Nostoc sp. NOS(2021)]MBN3893923.1 hypothetical protein [Nostoc sp. NOS(2021)]